MIAAAPLTAWSMVPSAREDSYPYVERGLYSVTLYGSGQVQAGATDYNISGDYEMMGTHRLAGSYTFCWDGLQPGGTGFETVVGTQAAALHQPRHARVPRPGLQPPRGQ